jgi:co-chaperonin GroES (HSP10)
MTIEAEEEFIVEHIGAKVENVKPGDRIVIAPRKAKSINSDDKFMISEDDILAVYTK